MSGDSELPAELIQIIAAALILRGHPGGGLFGRLSYSEPLTFDRPAELPINRDEAEEER